MTRAAEIWQGRAPGVERLLLQHGTVKQNRRLAGRRLASALHHIQQSQFVGVKVIHEWILNGQ